MSIATPERYFLDCDDDGHWFVIPVSRKGAWSDWLNLDSEDQTSWDAPDFARPIGGSHTLVTFTDPGIA